MSSPGIFTKSTRRGPHPVRGCLPLIAVAVLLLASCSSTAGAPSVTGAWVRPTTGVGNPVAGYLVITNATGRDEALVGASTPAASSIELHRTMSASSGGMTGMTPVQRISLPAGSTVTLAPGGFHMMLIGLVRPLVAGDTVEIDLVFEHAGNVAIKADVRQN